MSSAKGIISVFCNEEKIPKSVQLPTAKPKKSNSNPRSIISKTHKTNLRRDMKTPQIQPTGYSTKMICNSVTFHEKFEVKRGIKAVFYSWVIVVCKNNQIGEMKCNSVVNYALEQAFRKEEGPKTYEYTTSKGTCKYDLASMTATVQGQEQNGTKYVLERHVYVCGRRIQLGKYWNPIQSHTCQLFVVPRESQEFRDIEESLKSTIPTANIENIHRVQNLFVYQRYYIEQRRVAECPEDQNEKFLFHGTKNIPPGTIISSQEGFDTRLAGNQNLWGPGAYFAEEAKYVDDFAFRTLPAYKQIIVASVTLGSCFDYGTLCNPTLKEPPINIHTKQRYDSVSGITKGSRVYAVFNSAQCCPRYIVKYTTET